jgi:branched-chain amino acid transport system ATP-binding protein
LVDRGYGMERMLEAKDICQYFDGVHAVDHFSLHVDEGEILGIIGPNGSGKTTFFNTLSGLYPPTSGSFHFCGQDITGLAPHRIVQRGISRTFQNLRTFRTLTVRQNVIVGQHSNTSTGVFDSILRTGKHRREEKITNDKAEELIGLVGLNALVDRLSCELSYGQQKRLELARALASESRLLLLDEPTAGIPSGDAQELLDLILRLREERGVTVIIIEHNMRAMKHVANRVIAMDRGRKIYEGSCDEVLSARCVIEAYLGEEECSK